MKDDVIPLSRFAALGRTRGTKRINALLSHPKKDPATLVAELPLQDLYFLIKETGLSDSVELLALATPEQVQGFLDLESWDGDHFRLASATPWLTALMTAGPEKLTSTWRLLDPELTALMIGSVTRTYNLHEQEVPDDEEPPFFPTPDRAFMVKICSEDPDTIGFVERTLDYLYRVDAELARHTIRTAGSETIAYLEEQCYRWRSGRMQDLGYADFYEALEVYRPLDIGQVRIGEATADKPADAPNLPAILAEPIHAGFLGQVLAQIVDAPEARRIESALVTLFNRVLSADRVPPGDPDLAAGGALRAAATLSLGLEAVARGTVDQGILALRSIALTRLHRVGYTLTLRLRELLSRLGPAQQGLDEPWSQVAQALMERHPSYFRALDRGNAPRSGTRPFCTLADVRNVTTVLGQAALAAQFVYTFLKTDPAHFGNEVTLGDVGRTAVLRALLSQPPEPKRLGTKEIAQFVGSCIDKEHPKEPRIIRDLALSVEKLFPGEYSEAIRGWISDLEHLFGKLDTSQPIDLRFVGGVLHELTENER